MTSAPIDLSPSPAPGAPGGPGKPGTKTSDADGGVFAALVDQALSPGSEKPKPDPEGAATSQDAADQPGVAAQLAALLAVLLGQPVPPTGQPASTDPKDGQAGAAPAAPGAASLLSGTPAAGPDGGSVPAPATAPPTPAGSASPPLVPPAAAAAATAAGTPTGSARKGDSTDEKGEPGAPPADAGSVRVVASGPVTVTGSTGVAPTHSAEAPARAVAAQVIPEITRLVSDGEGVHRVTLQLNPRALGEVRVVLTMRHGDVHVRLAAGDEARHALAASSSDLSRALHQLGIDEHRITLSGLQGGDVTASGRSNTDHTGHHNPDQLAGGFDTDQHQNAQHSRMGDDTPATDGSSTSTPSDGAPASARIRPVHHTRDAGAVDLRM